MLLENRGAIFFHHSRRIIWFKVLIPAGNNDTNGSLPSGMGDFPKAEVLNN